MNFFKIKTSWSNAEFILIKLCIASAYILIGSYFHDFFKDYYLLLFILFGITAIWFCFAWLKKMKASKQQ
ncbi:hypothetical protein C8C83_2909 [Flavobacterium sp. 90]|uniref:hypothetical protein n=1 Tax=unclassified Flavobacterium TaxID=196869 RepID=UPI000EAB9EC0|nr:MULTISPECIES: hypothetical protein [unclassified Flavobacterium]RKR11209.1 hypothetical protein C8C82_3219 [Flavobacterium sp. 81]TCK54990.1 hypothetical protein C8C83_2909 [Flavobacterium sp. 90]